ncbi:MAG: RdgB/HAM1 family non-canonical purine NTP pyrophosphatase [Candidatus Margulisiibacteriota bacterium]|nr:RdgB/HAM1 family non-canonical purine NTP pyrophosphatase [Candidatus Margulisiibacteriota bacterium]
MKIIVATGNKHKLKEIEHILKLPVISCQLPVNEDGKTFEANAIKKAKAIRPKEGEIAIADDSGLMVDCLGGKPGVRSARFAIPPTPENLCKKLLKKMGRGTRAAKFVCVIAIVYPNGKIRTVKGVCRGRIATEMRGSKGFGYDPVFIPAGYKKTFAEMKPAMKNRISHRAKALRKMKNAI